MRKERKPGGGAKALPAADRRSEEVAVYITPGEKKAIEEAAREAGITLSDLVRRSLRVLLDAHARARGA